MADKVKILETDILSDNWYILKKIKYEYLHNDGTTKSLSREIYDRGNGATILLYNKKQKTVVLTKQFRMSTFVNGNPNGMLIETCAGLLDGDDPVNCIRRETEEETGYKISHVKKIFESYMSPGSVQKSFTFLLENILLP